MNQTKTLIIGAGGFVGSFISSFRDMLNQPLTPSRNEVDIVDKEALRKFINKHSPSVIVNFAAHTDLAEAEKQRGNRQGSTWFVNVGGVKNLAEVSNQHGIFLIHISTDAVFPGTEAFPGPYPESVTPPDNLKPLSWYGYTKLQGELAIIYSKARFALIRISYPFGAKDKQKDFACKLTELVKNGIPLFSDQEFTPTYLPDLREVIIKIVSSQIGGVLHVATKPATTPYEFGRNIARLLSLDKKVEKTSVKKYLSNSGSVPRVVRGGLLTSKTEEKLDIRFHSWQGALAELDSF